LRTPRAQRIGAGWQALAVLDNGAGIDLDALLAGGNLDYLI